MALSKWPILACIGLLIAAAFAFEFRGKEVIGFPTMDKQEADASAAAGNTLVWDERHADKDDIWWGPGKYMTAKKGEHEGDRKDRYFCVVTADRNSFANALKVRIPAYKAIEGDDSIESMYNNEDMIESYIDDVCYYDEGHSNTNDIRIVSDPHVYFYPCEIVIPPGKVERCKWRPWYWDLVYPEPG